MKNIHVLATDKPSRLVITRIENKLYYQPLLYNKTVNVLTQHIFITSDEEIKDGDWVYYENGDLKGIHKVVNGQRPKTWILRKIILTTDQDLIKNGVQAIDFDFLEWFVNNPSCEEVEVESNKCLVKRGSCDCSEMDMDCQCLGYKIIIPKEEQIQETLEEAAENYTIDFATMSAFKLGAKWQQERMYSEEDMAESFMACWKANVPEGFECKLSFKEWFEQFKKK